MTRTERGRSAFFAGAAVLAGGCADKSYALVSVTADSDITGIAQFQVTLKNRAFEDDTLAYPAQPDPAAALQIGPMRALTFSVSFRTSHHSALEIGVAPTNLYGAALGYGTASATIRQGKVTEIAVRVMRGFLPPARPDAGARDGRSGDAGPSCQPVNPAAVCGPASTCFVACRADGTGVGVCARAGSKQAGEACTQNEDCTPGTACFEFLCSDQKRGTCLRFCNADPECGPGARCTTTVPCRGGMVNQTSYKACSVACDPTGRGTTGCAPGLYCFIFAGEVADCDCRAPTNVGEDGAPCTDRRACAPGFHCVSTPGPGGLQNACRALCRLDAADAGATAAGCPAGRACSRLIDPEFKIYGACLPPP